VDAATRKNGCLEFSSFPADKKELIGLTADGVISKEVSDSLEFDSVEIAPGDAVVFSSYVPHRSSANLSGDPRRLLYLTYNKRSGGYFRAEYYANKRKDMADGRLSMINHFQGNLVDDRAARAEDVMRKIVGLLEERGAIRYDSFSTQEEHARVTALMALRNGASPQLVATGFLHDVGHLLLNEHAGRSDFLASDKVHEEVGARFLQRAFPAQVIEVIRLHVDAKRYLCAVDAGYHGDLSWASQQSLRLQGGPFSAEEAVAWAAKPFAREAAQLRKWEDEGKRMWASGQLKETDLPLREELLQTVRQALHTQ